MADVYTLGLAKIEIGNIAEDGGMGTTLAAWGQTLQGTCNITQDDPETNEFFAEELDDPVVSISKRGKTTLAFSIMNPDLAALANTLGGTVTGEAPNQKWNAPNGIPTIEKSVKVTPQQGHIWEFPRMKISAKINGSFSRENLFVIEVTGTALTPTKAGLGIASAYPVPTA
jgi:hypothetical protein